MNTPRWARGTGQWSNNRVMIVAADPELRDGLIAMYREQHEVLVARSPLEVINQLESEPFLTTVVLADLGGSSTCGELAMFLADAYPHVRVIRASEEPARPATTRVPAVLLHTA